MGQNNYDLLVTRIRQHCEQAAQDGLRLGPTTFKRIVTPFPPTTEQQVGETEQQFGFSLPVLLRLLYTRVANGGFGPGFGIIGAKNGFPGVNHVSGDIAHRYRWEIDFANACRQLYRGGWASLTSDVAIAKELHSYCPCTLSHMRLNPAAQNCTSNSERPSIRYPWDQPSVRT